MSLPAWELLSLHVSLGAVGVSWALCLAWGVHPSPSELTALWAAVSAVYCLDHASDASKTLSLSSNSSPTSSSTSTSSSSSTSSSTYAIARRLSQRAHLPLLKSAAAVSLVIGALSALFLTQGTLLLGLGLCALCALYLWWVSRLQASASLYKKLMVLVMYPLGLSVPVLSHLLSPILAPILSQSSLGGSSEAQPISVELTWASGLTATLQLVLFVGANLALFASMEREGGAREGGALTQEGRGLSLLSVGASALSLALLTLSGLRGSTHMSFGLIALLLGLFALLSLYTPTRLWLSEGERYRAWVDGLLLLAWLSPLLS